MGEAGRADSGDGRDALEQIAIGAVESLRRALDAALVAAPRLDPYDEHLVAGEAAILSLERLETAHEEPRAEEEQQAESDLGDDENLPRPEPVTATDRPARLALDAGDDIDSGSP